MRLWRGVLLACVLSWHVDVRKRVGARVLKDNFSSGTFSVCCFVAGAQNLASDCVAVSVTCAVLSSPCSTRGLKSLELLNLRECSYLARKILY